MDYQLVRAFNGISTVLTLAFLVSMTMAFYYFFQDPYEAGNELIKENMYQQAFASIGLAVALLFLGFIKWATAKNKGY